MAALGPTSTGARARRGAAPPRALGRRAARRVPRRGRRAQPAAERRDLAQRRGRAGRGRRGRPPPGGRRARRRSSACRCRSRTSRRWPAGRSPTARAARPQGPSEESELVVDALAARGLRPVRAHQHARVRRDHRRREQPLRDHAATRGTSSRSPGGSSGGAAAAVAGGHVPDRPRQRRRRLDPHPRLLLRPGRPEAEPRPRAAPRAELARRGRRGRRRAHRRRLRRACSTRSPARIPLAWYNAPAPARPFAQETRHAARARCGSG